MPDSECWWLHAPGETSVQSVVIERNGTNVIVETGSVGLIGARTDQRFVTAGKARQSCLDEREALLSSGFREVWYTETTDEKSTTSGIERPPQRRGPGDLVRDAKMRTAAASTAGELTFELALARGDHEALSAFLSPTR